MIEGNIDSVGRAVMVRSQVWLLVRTIPGNKNKCMRTNEQDWCRFQNTMSILVLVMLEMVTSTVVNKIIQGSTGIRQWPKIDVHPQ